jgi:hypothetical protein
VSLESGGEILPSCSPLPNARFISVNAKKNRKAKEANSICALRDKGMAV